MAIPAALSTVAANSTYTAAQVNAIKARDDFIFARPSVRVYNTANISVPDSTVTALTFNSERWDYSTSLHSTSSNTSRITIPTGYDGEWFFWGNATFDSTSATGLRRLLLRVNGGTVIARHTSPAAPVGISNEFVVSAPYRMTGGDYVELCAYQTSGGALNVNASGNVSPEFAAIWNGL